VSSIRTVGVVISAILVYAPAVAVAAPSRQVPREFIGVVADGPVFEDETLERAGTSLELEMDLMVRTGVESIRLSFYWERLQPYRSWDAVPVGAAEGFRDSAGIPTDFRATDRIVRSAAQRGLSLLPVVLGAPGWAARHPGEFASPPADPRTYAAFVQALAERYGSRGSFWGEHPGLPRMPLTEWQLWNEPTFRNFWLDQPFQSDYVALLRESRRALRRGDKRARIILAGLVYESWEALEDIYRAGGRRWFDTVALHPFTRRPADVLRIIERNRTVMARYGDRRKAIYLSELSWPSARGRIRTRYGYETDERGQARRLARGLRLLAANRRRLEVRRVYWYTWLGRETSQDYPFDYSGLRRVERGGISSKPAFRSYRRTALRLEGCRIKRRRATSCG
jgi:hypothetical protein